MSVRSRIGNSAYNHVWDSVDDAIGTSRKLSDIYDGVPPELDCYIDVLELHVFPSDKREVILKWLNEENKGEVDQHKE